MSLKWMPRGVAFLVGAASLVQEVLWVRLAGFATGGLPETFATILALYLLGIAVGAQLGRRLCVGRVLDIRRRASRVLLLSALVDIAAPFLFSWGIGFLPVTVAMLPLVIATAALKSALFPVVHHLGSNDAVAWKGGSFSKVYFANVAGCTLGPLIVTLWLMDVMAMEQLFVGVATVTAVAGMWLAGLRLLAVPAVVVAIATLVLQPALPALASRIVMATGGSGRLAAGAQGRNHPYDRRPTGRHRIWRQCVRRAHQRRSAIEQQQDRSCLCRHGGCAESQACARDRS